MRLGFIGAGRMGRPIVDRLRAAGHEVTVLVRRPESRPSTEADGLTCAGTVAETVRGAEAVFVAVLTDEQVRSVCLGPDGALTAMRPGATLVQHTTSDPATARLLTEGAVERGIRVLDAALSGSPQDITEGRLTLWVGGDETVLADVRPLLATYASPILRVGAEAGDGQRVKLVNNALFVAQVGLAIDAVRLAGSLGIDERTLLGALPHGSGASRALAVVAGGGSVDAVAERLATLMRKDVTVVHEVARNAGADLGIIGTVLASEAVAEKVLGAARTPDDQGTGTRRAAS
ncbi:NAD(P)-dependent oxidoreductase [Streptomyces turgidiscabies]|uniref:NAD binding domain of 6-phosphogluconate dehydrogenase n=1 Tax=Streptomyces turgidiscabies (strain Car8) TaxID=698760 RepID=L7FAK7_STRT8|nr:MULTISPECIES: NAD(P)-dependent oxidoreductase [Streptomyces]ELP68297.1 NAD binding domain of 6-phosphogluconate dehydrogenase [Streptomyces turgidiscabies Car8]MDX3492714.1 NAD(P)-dependent oxidoreductase [Streptomyces turgidiscabies]GAQ75689.1 2-hydroxy-3-oxopropionate reductase [Streptomyces turgidiscabies]